MLANRGQEIFVEASLRQEKWRRLCSKVLGCWLFCQLWEDLGLRKFLAREGLVGAAKAPTWGSTCWKVWWLID